MTRGKEAVSGTAPRRVLPAGAAGRTKGGMDQIIRLLMRMAYWVRRPPSRAHMLVLLAVVAVVLACIAVEALWGWPSWLSAGRAPRNLGFRPL